MNDRQSFALENPVTDSEDLDEQFARTLTRSVRKFGTILTVDLHKKEFFWHACVTLLNPEGKPIPINKFSLTQRAVTLRLALELLGDVGRPDSNKIHEDKKSIHIIRPVTIEEEREVRKVLASKGAKMTTKPKSRTRRP
jgi:hypothetical protein